MRLWEGGSGKLLATFQYEKSPKSGPRCSVPGGARILTVSADRSARLWEGALGEAADRLRNARLTAIRSFFRLVALRDPASAGVATRVLAIPLKRTNQRLVGYLTRAEIDAILAANNLSEWSGRRDHVLLLTLYNTGARVSEMTSLDIDNSNSSRNPLCNLMARGARSAPFHYGPPRQRFKGMVL